MQPFTNRMKYVEYDADMRVHVNERDIISRKIKSQKGKRAYCSQLNAVMIYNITIIIKSMAIFMHHIIDIKVLNYLATTA